MRMGRSHKRSLPADEPKEEPVDSEDDEPLSKTKDTKDTRRKRSKAAESSSDDEEVKKEIEDDEVEYEVQAVLDVRGEGADREFLVRWKGFSENDDTWEPEENLSCKDMIEAFLAEKAKSHKRQSPVKAPKKGKRGRKPASKNVNEGSDEEEEESTAEYEVKRSPAKTPKKGKKGRKSAAKNGNESSDEDKEESTAEYEVKSIIEVHFKKNGQREFLVRWKGFSSKDDTWEPEEHLNCPKLIEEFEKKMNKAKSVVQRETRVQRKKTDHFAYDSKMKSKSTRTRGLRRTYYDED